MPLQQAQRIDYQLGRRVCCVGMVLNRQHGDRYREMLGLHQKQVNAFSRRENGKTKTPEALIKLLNVLERHPDLLNEVRSA